MIMALDMLDRLQTLLKKYPGQFWLMTVGLFISTTGASMIWPFLMIYVSKRLGLPLSQAATLVTINATTSLFTSFIAGPVTDRVGRKFVMVVSLTTNGLIYLLMSHANTYLAFAGLMFLTGASNPLYRVGADAMLADLIPSEKRVNAYALVRMITNAAFAIGPAAGGFIASRSYDLAFYCAAGGMLCYSLLLIFRAVETLSRDSRSTTGRDKERWGGYDRVMRDKTYTSFALLMGLGLIAPAMLWVLLSVYANKNFGISEAQYGWIPTTNAIMCVTIQFGVTWVTKRYRPLPMIALGMLTYALGVGSVARMTGFWGFWLSMVIITFGELILVPTATTYVADLAPADMRGRYMSIYWLSFAISQAIGPMLGGYLNDYIAPTAIWYGGLLIGLTSTAGLLLLTHWAPQSKADTVTG